MPLAFPSHQGLIAPLWRRWPHRFDPLGCGVGAAVPDVVDGALSLALRGHLGQWYGHSLLGSVMLCIPVGLALSAVLPRIAPRLFRASNASSRPSFARLVFSVWFGAFSHLFFDFISHGNFLWLLPWYAPERVFPDSWYAHWLSLRVPGYPEPYPIGTHFV